MDKWNIRYKYSKWRKGFSLDKISCPVCKSQHKNWTKIVEHPSWDGKIKLLVECWSGDTLKDLPSHLYLIELSDLPSVEVSRRRKRKLVRKVGGRSND